MMFSFPAITAPTASLLRTAVAPTTQSEATVRTSLCRACGSSSGCECHALTLNPDNDVVELSPEARAKADGAEATAGPEAKNKAKPGTQADAQDKLNPDPQDPEQEQLQKLKARDAEVRAHEMAHVTAGGPYVISGPHYETQTGPDGREYAIGGHVNIDTAPVEGDPEATIRKMDTVRAAAMAPAEPSGADHAVAAKASAQAAKARAELSSARFDPSADRDAVGTQLDIVA